MRAAILAVMFLVVGALVGRGRAADAKPDEARSAGAKPSTATATFAGGCFWCMEPPFEKLAGVVSVTAGYTGGSKSQPTYEEVSAGETGHAESVEIVFDPAKVTYEQLLDVFWHQTDPVAKDAQFCDHGTQYRSAIFTHDDQQRRLAEASRDALAKSGRFTQPLVTQIVAATPFWPAEDYHQDYYQQNPIRYAYYRRGCGRDRRLEEIWGPAAASH